MINIQLDNPLIEQYIKIMGKEKLEKMFLSFLDMKSKFDTSSITTIETIISTNQRISKEINSSRININSNLHNQILALKPSKTKSKMHFIREEISSRINKNLSSQSIRDEYYKSKGYL